MAALEHSLMIHNCKFLESVLPMSLQHLKELENHISTSNCCPHPPGIQHFTFGRSTAWTGTTPLLLACQHGELDSVKHIVESWRGVDVCASATFYSNLSKKGQPTIGKATPLFIAALYGYDNIVRYLVEKGANVSFRTSNENGNPNYDGLTPLYAAVSKWQCNSRRTLLQQREDRSNVVRLLLESGADPVADTFRPSDGKTMWMEPMCGVDAVTMLIDNGLDLKRPNPQTGEALLLSVMSRTSFYTEEGLLAIIKQLADKSADLLVRDANGFTPLLRAADDKHNDGRLNLSILDFLLERDEYSQIEKIEALELAGATILFKAQNAPHLPKAFDYWRRSLHLRHQMAEKTGSSKKISGRKIGRHLEWTTFAELVRLMFHPEEHQIQALLVKLRILSSSDGYRHQSLFSQYIMYISDSTTLEDGDKFTQILDIRLEMFGLMIRRLNPPPTYKPFIGIGIIVKDVEVLVSALSTLHDNHPSLLSFEKLKTALGLILLTMDHYPFKINRGEMVSNNSSHDYIIRCFGSRFSTSLFHVLEMMFYSPEMTNVHETNSLLESLRLLGYCQLGNLILQACQKLDNFKVLALVRFLLEAGADPNVTVNQCHRNAPLHIFARMTDRRLGDAAGMLLLEFGAKLHQVNIAGKTALDIWIQHNETEDKWNEETGGWSARPAWCLPVQTLLRLAGRVIRVNKIPYANGKTPTVLHSLIQWRRNVNYY